MFNQKKVTLFTKMRKVIKYYNFFLKFKKGEFE